MKNKQSSRRRQLGAATAMDMMLTFPIFATMMLFMIQMALVLHAYTVVQYSAYTAARAARVHVLDGDHAFLEMDFPGPIDFLLSLPNLDIIAGSIVGNGSLTGLQNGVQERVTAAAMKQLVSISPATEDFNVGGPGTSWHAESVNQYMELSSASYEDPTRADPLKRKANYAYNDANTEVEFKFLDFDNAILQEAEDVWRIYETVTNTAIHSQINIPVTVTVRYRYRLQIPVGQWFFVNDPEPDQDQDQGYYRWMEASVKLM